MQFGAAVRRVEDPPLITGASHYVDDLRAEDVCHAVFVRSGLAHARITGVDTAAAEAAPGVLGVFRAPDLGLGSMPAGDGPEGMARAVLAGEVVRFVGEPVAVVVAETRAGAVDAADLVEVDYDPLDGWSIPRPRWTPDAPRLFPEHGDNLAPRASSATRARSEDAEVVVRGRYVNRRVAAVPDGAGRRPRGPRPRDRRPGRAGRPARRPSRRRGPSPAPWGSSPRWCGSSSPRWAAASGRASPPIPSRSWWRPSLAGWSGRCATWRAAGSPWWPCSTAAPSSRRSSWAPARTAP